MFSKQSFFPFFYFLAISVAAISCTPKGDTNKGDRTGRDDVVQVPTDNYRGRGIDNSKTTCDKRNAYSEEISFENLEFVNFKQCWENIYLKGAVKPEMLWFMCG